MIRHGDGPSNLYFEFTGFIQFPHLLHGDSGYTIGVGGKPARKIKEDRKMRNNLYDVSKSVYGREVSNMQPIAFGYVPAKKRSETIEAIENPASCIGEHCKNRDNGLFTRTAVQHG
jgi:hypothetical protein